VERFMSDLDIHKDIKPLVRIPVMLNMAAIIHKVDSNFPDSKYQLYQHVSELYLSGKLERRRKMAAPPMSHQDQQYCMIRLGFEMQKQRTWGGSQSIILHYKEVKKHCIEALKEAHIGKSEEELDGYCAEYLDSLHKRSTILIPQKGIGTDTEFAFMHLSYQDFYASCHIRILTNSFSDAHPEEAEVFWAALREVAKKEHWSEIFILFLESFLIENTSFSGSICRKIFDKLEVQPKEYGMNSLLYKKVMLNSFLMTRLYSEQEILEIKVLDLSQLQLKELSRVVLFKNLEILWLEKNQLTNLKPLKKLKKLTSLNLKDNQLTDLKPLEKLKKLTKLTLENNQLTDLKPLKKLKKLTELALENNQITDLKPLKKLKKLTSLNLKDNQITDLKPLEKLTKLTSLNLKDNQITDLKPLEKLTKLTSLNLKDNQITDLKPLEKLTNLTVLHLERNQITDLKPLENLTNLRELCLENNQLTDLKPLENLTNLTRLLLSNNQITDLKPLENLTNLIWLNLNRNQIIDLKPLENLTNLIGLNLKRNQIIDLKILENLTNLKILHLENNQIADLKTLENLTKLKYLSLENNPSISESDIQKLQIKLKDCKNNVRFVRVN
jgi:Leucine-rich repeat (LRR) protein